MAHRLIDHRGLRARLRLHKINITTPISLGLKFPYCKFHTPILDSRLKSEHTGENQNRDAAVSATNLHCIYVAIKKRFEI